MPRAKSTGGSPAKKSGKTPGRHTTPRKKSKTPRKGKSPAAKRGRSRSVSKSRASPKKSARKSPGRPKSVSKSPSIKSTPRRRSRSRSQNKSAARTTPSIAQKVKSAAQVIEHKIATPVQSLASSLRSRRAAHEQALNRFGGSSYATSTASRRQPIGQSLLQRVRNCHFASCFVGVRRRFRWPAVKRHLKKNWVRYLVLVATAAGAYYSYQNKKYLEKVVNEQYNKLAELIQQQKGSTFSKYFSGWFDEGSSTTQQPPTIPPRTVNQQQVPQPPHHSTQTGGK